MNAIILSAPPVPREWGARIEPWLQRPLRISIPVPTEGSRLLVELNAYTVQSGLHWMIRHTWHSKYRHPKFFKRSTIGQTKCLGLWLKQLRNLCIQIQAAAEEFGIHNQKSATDWFYQIVEELFYIGLCNSIFALYPESLKQYDDGTQRGIIRGVSDACSKAKAFEPPACGSALSELILIAASLAEKSDGFRADHYMPFIKAWREWIAEQKKWHQHQFTGEGEFLLQVGKGRGKRNLSSIKKTDP